ncbi:MAG TPA: cache domain-containing protein [Thermoanaerobaculia bacterium]|nr:cache domain-containing protein [Thermoanaerobaculia bacterium]
MADTLAGLAPRQSLFDRLRAPMAFLFIAAGALGAGYYFFLQRKIDYYTNRDARLIARSGQQILRAVRNADGMVKNASKVRDAAALKDAAVFKAAEDDLTVLYKIDGRPSEEQRVPSKIFKEISIKPPDGKPSEELLKSETDPREHRYATRNNDGLLLNFEVMTKDQQQYASGKIELRQLLKPLQQSIAGVFDSFFILDSTGEVIYQAQKAPGDDSGSNVRIVRLNELTVPKTFEKAQTLKVADLMSVSRKMAIQLGDNNYQLFSVPIPSSVHIEEGAHAKGGEEKHDETWVVCGLVSQDDFRSRSLQISVTVLSCLAAAVLLVIFSWPFVKMAMTGPQNKTTMFDVILLGLCAILAMAIVSVVAIDWLTYDKLEQSADQQLDRLALSIEDKFNADIATAVDQLDGVQQWAGTPPGTPGAPLPPDGSDVRSGNLPAAKFGAPFFQSVSLIDEKGMQRAKWSVDRVAPPLVSVGPRTYFASPFNNGREYISVLGKRGEKRRLTIDSVRSTTTGQTEVVFGRTIDEMAGERSPLHGRFAVMAMSVSSPMSVLNAIVPEDFGFAVIDPAGTVLFHSQSERNMSENFFLETDQDPKVRAAVAARQTETTDVRYWGDDYRVHSYPLKRLPWTLVTFREKSGVREINTEALLTTMVFLLVLHAGGLLLFIVIVLLLRPGYRAAWLWPDPNRLRDYSDLAIAYIALFVVGACLICTMEDGALVAFPFAFVPFVLMVTYVYLRGTGLLRAKVFLAFAIVAALVLASSV